VQGVPGEGTLLGLCLGVSTGRHAWSVGRSDAAAVSSRATGERDQSDPTDSGGDVGRQAIDDFRQEIDIARRIALRKAKGLGLKGPDAEDLVGDAYLAMAMLCTQWDEGKGIPRHVYVGKYCESRMTDLHRERHGRKPPKFVEVPFDDEWDTPELESGFSEFHLLMDRIPEGRERYVVNRLLEGAFHREIAAELGISKTRVAQLIERVQKWCEAEL